MRTRSKAMAVVAAAALCATALEATARQPVSAVTPAVITVDATSDLGPIGHLASGLLNSDAADPTLAQPIRPKMWRGGGPGAWANDHYNRAREHGAKTMWVLGDDWIGSTGNAAPWTDWAGYERFVKWSYKRYALEFPAGYIDIQNEPEGFSAKYGTRQNYLDTYLHAAKAMREAKAELAVTNPSLPAPKIVGPSTSQFQDKPYNYTCTFNVECEYNTLVDQRTRWIDLQTFLDYAANPSATADGCGIEANLCVPIQLDEISWHEICFGGEECSESPHDIEAHVAKVRQMIAARPALGHPDVSINEYMAPQFQLVPGWVAGELAAMESINVESSSHSCWPENALGDTDGCFTQKLDSLVGPDLNNSSDKAFYPRSAHWVYKAYADMTGERLATSVPTFAPAADPSVNPAGVTSGSYFSAVATRDDANNEVRVLTGRHVTPCFARPDPGCGDTSAPAVSVDVTVPPAWGSTSVNVKLARLQTPLATVPGQDVSHQLDWPSTYWQFTVNKTGFTPMSTSALQVVNGKVSVPINAMADGDAWTVTVDKGAAAADPAVPPMPSYFCPLLTCLHAGSAGAWSATGSMYYPRSLHQSTTMADGRVVLSGGYYNGGDRPFTKVYDPTTGTWSTAGNMGTARRDFVETLLNDGTVLAAGGLNAAAGEIFHPATGMWTPTANMQSQRVNPTSTLLTDGRVLLAGGYANYSIYNAALPTAEIYDPSNNTWTSTGLMTTPRAGATATRLADGRVLVAGGSPTNGVALASAEVFDPRLTDPVTGAKGVWTAVPSMGAARAFHAASALPDGSVLVVGGGTPTGLAGAKLGQSDIQQTGTAERFNPTTGVWTAAGAVTPRARHTATPLHDGRVLVVGGVAQDGSYLASAYVYDPTLNTWSKTGSLGTPRAFHTANILGNGQVLVAGGADAFSGTVPDQYGYENDLSSGELYAP